MVKRIKENSKLQKGVTLIELIIAFAVLMTGVMAAFNLLIQSLGLTRVVADRYKANFLAIEGIELAKNLSDSNIWGAISAGAYEVSYKTTSLPLTAYVDPGRFLHLKDGFYSYDSSAGSLATPFRRQIQIAYPDDCALEPRCGDHLQVNSIVSWKSRGDIEFSINLEDHFFNWNQF